MSKRNPKSAKGTKKKLSVYDERGRGRQARRTDVCDTTSSVDHDVAVMTILDLNDVAEERVGRHRLDKVGASLLERDAVRAAVLEDEEASQVVDLGSTHLVARGRVRDHVDDSALLVRA
jgi:hypothetical protein